MINYDTIPFFPAKVEIQEEFIVDNALGCSHSINFSAHLLLKLVDGNKNISAITKEASLKYKWNEKAVKEDLLYLIFDLNHKGLINLKNTLSFSTFMNSLMFLYFSIINPAQFKLITTLNRTDFKDKNLINVFLLILKTSFINFRWLWISSISIFIGAAFYGESIWGFQGSLLILISIIGIVLHESFHFWSFTFLNEGSAQCFLLAHSMGMSIRRKTLKLHQEIIVSLIGPLMPSLIGVTLIISGTIFKNLFILLGGVVLAVHLLSLLPFSIDGKIIYKSLLLIYKNKYKAVNS